VQEILLPRTDAGVLLQAAVVFPALVGALVAVRRDRDIRMLLLGILVPALALFGLRALH
jgi:hypothetical protein